jgi:hypothetical protein
MKKGEKGEKGDEGVELGTVLDGEREREGRVGTE